MWQGGLLFDNLLAFLSREQPDILMLQEVLESAETGLDRRFYSVATIRQHLSLPHVDFAPALIDIDDGHRTLSGNAVISRWPITASRTIAYNQPFGERTEHTPQTFADTPRNLQHVILQADGNEINIFNTQGVWDLDGENPSTQRKAMCATIAQETAGKQHVVFAGDTNLNPTNSALAPIDAQLESVFKHELATSFNVRRKDLEKFPGYATAVVDLMYVGADVHVISHSCPDVDISDHLPLIAVLEI
jgi:endonuclease/exonuclease/phosphatase family metal-dependent hydrolase